MREEKPAFVNQQTEPLDSINKYRQLYAQDTERKRWAEQTLIMANNINRSAVLRAKANLAIQTKSEPWDIILLLTEAIGLATGDMTTHLMALEAKPGNPVRPP